VVSECIIYILYYILAYIQHNGDVSLGKKIRAVKLLRHSNFLFLVLLTLNQTLFCGATELL